MDAEQAGMSRRDAGGLTQEGGPAPPPGAPAAALVPDTVLMSRYAGGDTAAFEQIYRRHEKPVYRFLLRSVGIAALADELHQDVWMSVIRNAAGYEPRALFTTWLYRIARTRLIDHWRARDPQEAASLDAPAGAGLAPVDDIADEAAARPEALAILRAHARALALAVQALPAAQREVFLLHAVSGLALAQVGEVTGAGFETAKSRFRYACARLRELMKDWRDD